MIQTPGWFISTMAEMRSAVPSHRPGYSRTGWHRIAVQRHHVELCPGSARLRISVALPFRTWKSTRSPSSRERVRRGPTFAR